MIQEKSLKKNAFFNVINTLMKLLFPLITFPYASRILLPDGIGKVNFANSVISYFALIASLGIGTYGIRESAKIRNNKEEFSQFFIEIFTININKRIKLMNWKKIERIVINPYSSNELNIQSTPIVVKKMEVLQMIINDLYTANFGIKWSARNNNK